MRSIGYQFDSRELVAADYGAPTTRKRWYAVFRRDGKPIAWPDQTHSRDGKDGYLPWVPVSTVLDFSSLGKSIFGRKKPLAENTMRRIARGLDKFVFRNPEPFIVQVNHSGSFRGQSIYEPMPTLTAKHGFGSVTPYIMQIGQTGFTRDRNREVSEPLSTVVTKNEHCLISPLIIQHHSETAKGAVRGQAVTDPVMTLDTSNRHGMASAFLTKFYGTCTGQGIREPLHTITASPGHFGKVSVLTVDKEELLAAGIDAETAEKCTWVSRYIMEYYGCGTGQPVADPLHTVVSRDRFALITVLGSNYVILDIFLRMLTAEELKLAQGFPADYIIDRDYTGKPYPISERVARIGNSVVPIMAQKLVEANCRYLRIGDRMPNMRIDDSREQLSFAI